MSSNAPAPCYPSPSGDLSIERAANTVTTVLVVDDQPKIRKFLRKILGNKGHQVVEAADASEGWRRALEIRPDLIISDILMPAMDGYEFVRLLRGNARTAHIPVILVTAVYHEKEQRALARSCGVFHFLTKPVRPKVLLQAVRAALASIPLDAPLPVSPAFEQEHLHLVAAKLRENLANLQQANRKLKRHAANLEREKIERLRAEQELENLSHRLLEVQENERRALARELHDEFGQLLTALQLSLATSARAPAAAFKGRLGDCQSLVWELLSRVRALSAELRPAMLDDLGLVPTLRWFCEQFQERTGLCVTFETTGPAERCTGPIASAAYRIVQEALTNVARHAQTQLASVRVGCDAQALTVRIEDRGVGFDPAAKLALRASVGLLGMRERATLLGGRLTIDSEPGAGTRLMAVIPAPAPSDDRGA